MTTRHLSHQIVSFIVLLSMLLSPLSPLIPKAVAYFPDIGDPVQPAGDALYRTTITLRRPGDLNRLEQLGITILKTTNQGQTTTVLADEDQLETLARLGYRPQATAPLPPRSPASLLKNLIPLQQTTLPDPDSLDDDADGLTNTQEQWWCTDPFNADSDGDGTSDGNEVQALQEWLGNQRGSYPSSGKPFAGWPPLTDSAGYPDRHFACQDDDLDSVPDLAERWELGLNMNRESTDRDKFDDGQELFGNTYCPGSGGFCGYGALPRNEDWGIIFAEMPSWVKAPGNHPLVAAFPIPEIDVVESSLYVETVTQVTTDHTIGSGTQRSYSTAKTEGTSTSVADTVTWNEWQEVSVTSPLNANSLDLEISSDGTWWKFTGQSVTNLGAAGTGAILGLCFTPVIGWGTCIGGAALLGTVTVAGIGMNLLGEKLDTGSSNEISDDNQPEVKCSSEPKLSCQAISNISIPSTSDVVANQTIATSSQDRTGTGGTRYTVDEQSRLSAQHIHQSFYPIYRPQPTTTNTKGHSWGGAQTTSNTQYEEHTVTSGEAFSNEEAWGTATAVNSVHTADLWFTYQVRNNGTEYAREIANLAFNIYIGDDPNPITTYFVASDIGGNGKFENFMPDEEHTYTSGRIALTLEQMKAIDLGALVLIVVDDYTYGIDELFYQDAVNANVIIAMEDGLDDGAELIDNYLLPTWGEETALDVLARYFPHKTDAEGQLIAIWTPEYRADTPSWCIEPQRVGTTLWCKHALSTADWWNIYTDGLGTGSEAFQDTPAAPGAVALFRFNKDTDLDGYGDRSEQRLGTDPNDAASYPKPELLAGMHNIRSGNAVTATLSLLNTGLYDAYGVEAVMIAPDNSVNITNNTVGGSGRVRALKQVIVGSRIKPEDPLPAQWTQAGHALPGVGGYYTGDQDRTYTFTVQCGNPGGCDVGSGTWSLAWNDGAGAGGTLNFDSGYASPTLLAVGSPGVKLGLYSGNVYDGESFTAAATTPRDTFQYTINYEPFTEPIVIVSYNDPQGNHRFIIPSTAMTLTTPTDNLANYAGQMLQEAGLEMFTTANFTPGANTTNLVANNPTDKTLTEAHLFLEFINISGTVVSEVPVTTTVSPGPNVAPVSWNSGDFDPAYNPDEDYIVLAFWTDYEGNILDTAGRPLSSFQEDPNPVFAMSGTDAGWDFGTAQQGTILKRNFAVANTGYLDMLTYVSAPPGVSLSQTGSRSVSPGDMTGYQMVLNTIDLPTGSYSETITVRASDPDQPSRTITIQGNVTPLPPDSPGGATLRPLDWTAVITGDHSQGEWVEFGHTLGPNPDSLHPVKVYSQDYGTLWGMGKYATNFGQGTASADMFGDGSDSNLVVGAGQTIYLDNVRTAVAATAVSEQNVISITSASGFNVGDEVLIIQMQGTDAGNYELDRIVSIGASTITLQHALQYTYTVGPYDRDPNNSRGAPPGVSTAQVIIVPNYLTVTIASGGRLTAHGWNGLTGGIVVLRALNLIVETGGVIDVTGLGYRGGTGGRDNGCGSAAYTGEGWPGPSWSLPGDVSGTSGSRVRNGNGGGSGFHTSDCVVTKRSGGGGGHATLGGIGGPGYGSGEGGGTVSDANGAKLFFGGGGGGGIATNQTGPRGGNGGGIVVLFGRNISVAGDVLSSGHNGYQISDGGSGGGAGGYVFLVGENIGVGSNNVVAIGGSGVDGDGGDGRIHVEYCDTLSVSTNPTASTQKLDCYIAEQIESSPYDRGQLNLPESFTGGRTYQVQYGRRLVFGSAGEQTPFIRLPKQLYTAASLDTLVSNTGASSGGLNLSLDIGNDDTPDWNYNATTPFPVTLAITNVVDALNPYLVSRTDVGWGADVDVPVRVQIDRQAEVILTNLILSLQFNQPGGLAIAAVDTGADRPLDWATVIPGDHNQGEQIDFTHTLGPDPVSIHPCLVYDQGGSTLKGVGKYCSDFGSGTVSSQIFGTGSDGDLVVGSGQTAYTDNVRTSSLSEKSFASKTK